MRAEVYFYRVEDISDLVYRKGIVSGDSPPSSEDCERYYERVWSFDDIENLRDVFKRCWLIARRSSLIDNEEDKRSLRPGDIVYLDGEAYMLKHNGWDRFPEIDRFSSNQEEVFGGYMDRDLYRKMEEGRRDFREKLSEHKEKNKE